MKNFPQLLEAYKANVGDEFPLEAYAIKDAAALMKYAILAMIPIGYALKVMKDVGNALDIFQHVFMESLANAMPDEIKPKAVERYLLFASESIRELTVDMALVLLPIPFIDIYTRFRAIKSELRQLWHIEQMEAIYKESAKKTDEKEAITM